VDPFAAYMIGVGTLAFSALLGWAAWDAHRYRR
jgi:hypothetical protein